MNELTSVDYSALRSEAEAASAAGRWFEALEVWKRLLALCPQDASAYSSGGRAALELGHLEEAEILLSEAVQRGTNQLWSWLDYGTVAIRRDDWAEARVRFRSVLERYPDCADAYERLGYAERHLGNVAAAEAVLSEGARRFPSHPWVRLQHAEVASQAENWEEALERWEQFAADFPSMPDGFFRSASAALKLGRTDDARIAVELGLKIAPTDIYARRLAIEIDIARNDLRQAAQNWLDGLSLPMVSPPFFDIGARLLVNIVNRQDNLEYTDDIWRSLLDQPYNNTLRYLPAIIGQILPLSIHDPSAFALFKSFALKRIPRGQLSAKMTNIDLLRFVLQDYGEAAEAQAWLRQNLSCITPAILSAIFDFLLPKNLDLIKPIILDLFQAENQGDNAQFNLALLAATIDTTLLEAIWDRSIESYIDTSAGPGAVLRAAGNRRRIALKKIIPIPANRRLKIALCISGQLRGYAQAHATWNVLGLERHDTNTYVHVWENIGRKLPFPPHSDRAFPPRFAAEFQSGFQHYGMEGMERQYPNLIGWFRRSGQVDMNDLKRLYKTDSIIVESEEFYPASSFANHQKMYYKVEKCYDLAVELGQEYDIIIRIRPDKSFYESSPIKLDELIATMKCRNLIYADGGYFLHYATRLGIGDQFAIGTMDSMDIYSRAYSITQYKQQMPDYYFPDYLMPHENFAFVAFHNGIAVEHCPHLRFAAPLDPERLTMQDLKLLLLLDTGPAARHGLDAALHAALDIDMKAPQD